MYLFPLDSLSFLVMEHHTDWIEPIRGGILLYVREDIPSKMLDFKSDIEAFFIEINLRKVKWLLSCSYNPSKSTITSHLDKLGYFLIAANIN